MTKELWQCLVISIYLIAATAQTTKKTASILINLPPEVLSKIGAEYVTRLRTVFEFYIHFDLLSQFMRIAKLLWENIRYSSNC